jgi:dihydropteroate synthase
MARLWHIRERTLPIGDGTLVMGILNVTPDSFSDGDVYFTPEAAVAHAEKMISEGADIIDVGGESTRPGGEPVSAEEEIQRVVPVIEELTKRTDTPVSIDTTKSEVARAALDAGASIVNDISGLRFDFYVADAAARANAGLIVMHSRGTPATLHRLPPVADIIPEVIRSLRASVHLAERRGVKRQSMVIDPGIGFGKSQAQNLELIAKLDQLIAAFPDLPVLLGTSRKSFIGRILADNDGTPATADQRLHGTIASMVAAVLHGANVIRVHDVKASVDAVKTIEAIAAATVNNGS